MFGVIGVFGVGIEVFRVTGLGLRPLVWGLGSLGVFRVGTEVLGVIGVFGVRIEVFGVIGVIGGLWGWIEVFGVGLRSLGSLGLD